MKGRKLWIVVLLCLSMASVLTGCGDQKENEKQASSETTTEVVTTEKVTEFAKDVKKITFGDLTNGINFKTSGTKVTFSFEDIDAFDNSLAMEFSLTDAAYEQEPITMLLKDGQSDYTFDGLEKGKEYYIEVYPTKSAKSDSELESINEKNQQCVLKLEQ